MSLLFPESDDKSSKLRMSRRRFLRSVGVPAVATVSLLAAGCSPTAQPTATTKPAAAPTQAPPTKAPPTQAAPTAAAAPTKAAAAPTAGTAASPYLPPAVKASSPVKITWWNWHGWHTDTINKVAGEYKKQYDENVTIETTAYPDWTQERAAVRTALTGGAGPDLWATLPGSDMVTTATSGYALSYTDEMFKKDPNWQKDFYAFANGLFSVNDKVWSVTPITNAVGLWYNKGLFEANNLKPPTTYDEFKAVADAFKSKGITPIAYLCVGYVSHFYGKPELEAAGWLPRLPIEDLVYFDQWGYRDDQQPLISHLIRNQATVQAAANATVHQSATGERAV